MQNAQPVMAMRLETKKLIDELSSGAHGIGDALTDEQLRSISGADCRVGQKGYGYLQRAIRKVAKEHGIYWERIAGAGCIKRLTPDEALDSTRRDREHIARKAKWGMTKLKTINTAGLPAERATELTASAAQLGTLAMFASGKTTKALEARNVSTPLELPKLLESFPK